MSKNYLFYVLFMSSLVHFLPINGVNGKEKEAEKSKKTETKGTLATPRNWTTLIDHVEDLNLHEVYSRFMHSTRSPMSSIYGIFEQLLLAGLPIDSLPVSTKKLAKLFLRLTGMNEYHAKKLLAQNWEFYLFLWLSLRGLSVEKISKTASGKLLRTMLSTSFPIAKNGLIVPYIKTGDLNEILSTIDEAYEYFRREPSNEEEIKERRRRAPVVRRLMEVALLFMVSQGQTYVVKRILRFSLSASVLSEAFVRAAMIGEPALMHSLLQALLIAKPKKAAVIAALNKALLWAASQGKVEAVIAILAYAQKLNITLDTLSVALHVRTILNRTALRGRSSLSDLLGTGIELEERQRNNLEHIFALLAPRFEEIHLPVQPSTELERALPTPNIAERLPYLGS